MSTRSATHYELLGLSREATDEEIKAAFRAQAQLHHPDAGGDTEAMAALSAARDVLSDPVRRSDYDATLPSSGATRFSGWSRPSTPAADAPAAEDPARRGADEDEAPRRRSVEAESGDDPSVFRQRGESRAPTFHRSNDMTDEPRDNRFGAVAGSDADSSDDSSLPQKRTEERTAERTEDREIDRRDRSGARRFRFFGRDDHQPKDDTGEQSDQESSRGKSQRPEDHGRKEASDRRGDTESVVGDSQSNRDSSWLDDVKPLTGKNKPSQSSNWLDDVEPVTGKNKPDRGSSWIDAVEPVVGKPEPSRGSSWLDSAKPVVGKPEPSRGSSWLDSAEPVVGKTKPSRGSSWLDDVEPVVGEQKRWRR